jgi:cell wall-associated NlpC family hydrolase
MKSTSAIILAFCLAAPLAPAHADDQSLVADLSARVGSLVDRAQDLVLNAMGFMGIPYRWGGSTPESGFDCSGFVQYVFKQAAGFVLPRSSFDQIRQGVTIAREELKAGDLVFFNTMRATASHVGIYIGENRFIHAPRQGKTVEIADFTNSYWQARYDGARRMPL